MGCSNGNTETPEIAKTTENTQMLRSLTNKTSSVVNIGTSNLIRAEKDNVKEHYIVTGKIGSGSFGQVYKVSHMNTKQIRAMKMIKKEALQYQDDDKTFLKEIEVLSNLDHPNIIKIYEYFQDENNYYVITEYCDGGALIDKINRESPFHEYEAAIIMEQLFSAVFYIHSKGVVHRDIKPENILLSSKNGEDLNLKLIDFGTCNYFDKNTILTSKIGTTLYIAPEVLNKHYTNKCDMWSLGVLLYVLLSGSHPFYAEKDEDIMSMIKKGKFSLEKKEFDGVSQDAKNLIKSLLELDPNKRVSAEEAWKNEWVQKYSKNIENLSNSDVKIFLTIANLKSFINRKKFQHATIAFLVHQINQNETPKELLRIFKEFDKNGDGQLSYEEIKEGFKSHFQGQISDEELDEIILEMDLDKNKFIEYEEFLRLTIDPDLLLTQKNLRLAFDCFDLDHSGMLTPDEVKKLMGINACDVSIRSDEFIKSIMRDIDLNNDGKISFDEFKNIMMKVLKS